jgi:ATP-dependent Clp protease ATP-binding subunit ClpB
MASTTTSFSGVSLGLSRSVRTDCCNRNALFVQPPRMSFFPAKPRSLKALKSLQLSRNGAFPKGFQRFGRSPRPLVIRCDASSGRVSLVYFHLAKQKKKNKRFWIEFLLLFVTIALR